MARWESYAAGVRGRVRADGSVQRACDGVERVCPQGRLLRRACGEERPAVRPDDGYGEAEAAVPVETRLSDRALGMAEAKRLLHR